MDYTIDDNTDIVETNRASFAISPNPANKEVFIQWQDGYRKEVKLLNINGLEALEKVVNTSKITLDISGLSAGLYFVETRQNGEVSVQKLVIY